jgi:hypothetical protein
MIFIIFGGLKLLSISILLSVKKPGEKYWKGNQNAIPGDNWK